MLLKGHWGVKMFEFLKEEDVEIVGAFKALIDSCFSDEDKDDSALAQELLHQVKQIKSQKGEE
jgi:hypothetical protein